eukprot:5826577-Amphidinium_carterae.1
MVGRPSPKTGSWLSDYLSSFSTSVLGLPKGAIYLARLIVAVCRARCWGYDADVNNFCDVLRLMSQTPQTVDITFTSKEAETIKAHGCVSKPSCKR